MTLNLLLLNIIILMGVSMILFGSKGPAKVFGLILAPFGCVLKFAMGLLFLVVVGMMFVPGIYHKATSLLGPTRIHQNGAGSSDVILYDYPVGTRNADGRRSGDGWIVTQDFRDTGPEAVRSGSEKVVGRHMGEDWAPVGRPAAGEAVYAIADGDVIVASADRGFGHVVIIRHATPPNAPWTEIYSLYGHLSGRGLCEAGKITRGGRVGILGDRGDNGIDRSGRPFDPHLHFEIRTSTHLTPAEPGFGYADSALGFIDPTRRTSRGNSGENPHAWISF